MGVMMAKGRRQEKAPAFKDLEPEPDDEHSDSLFGMIQEVSVDSLTVWASLTQFESTEW